MENRNLKRKITNLWNELSQGQSFNPFEGNHAKSRAWMRLEILLIDEGLLIEQRKERKTDATPENHD